MTNPRSASRPAGVAVASSARRLRMLDVSKAYGEVQALQPVSLEIAPGTLTALLGPSGCGKTTTLRIIAGLEMPDQGRVLIGDRDVTDLAPNRRGLGMVFQNYGLFPHLSVFENVAFGLRMQGLSEARIGAKVKEFLELVQLPDTADRYPKQLSGGQQQRIALARALVTDPAILLLDEPLGALDKNLRESMQFELRQLQRSLGITTILVTHDQEEALTMSDDIVVMNHGRVIQRGSPKAIYERPSTRFVSEFLGTSNIFEVDISGAVLDGNARGQIVGTNHIISVASVAGMGERRVSLAVRPEKCWLSGKPASATNSLPGVLLGHVFRGSQHVFQILIDGIAHPSTVYSQASDIAPEGIPPPGGKVFYNWKPSNAVVLGEGV